MQLAKKIHKDLLDEEKRWGSIFHLSIDFSFIVYGFYVVILPLLTCGYHNADHSMCACMTRLVTFVEPTCERYPRSFAFSANFVIGLVPCFRHLIVNPSHILKVKRDEKKKLKSGPMAVNMSKVRRFKCLGASFATLFNLNNPLTFLIQICNAI